MKLVDTSGWLEFFTDGPLADEYASTLAEPGDVLTPTVVFYEVYKWTKRERTEEEALVAISQLQKTRVIELTETIALTAADLSLEHRLAMADSIVYATALMHRATLFTSDRDFASLPGVRFLEKSK